MPTAIIIDDSPIIRTQLKRLFAAAGYTIVHEGASADGLGDLYRKYRPTVISLDIVLPGIDGATAAAQLLAAHRDARVLMCTSMAAREKILACQKAGVAGYLLKPFNPDHVATVLKQLASAS